LTRTSNKNSFKKKPGGSRYAALAILVVICSIVGAYLFFKPANNVTTLPPEVVQTVPKSRPLAKPQAQLHTPPVHTVIPDVQPKPEKTYPKDIPALEKKPPQATQINGSGQLAIIIDDMGTSMQEARSLADIGVPLTFSIIPGLKSYREVATFAASHGIETMIHIPMQSKGWPERRLEANGLLVSMTDSEVSERMEGYVRMVPKAVGANNHTGSEFTEHEDKMQVVLEALKGRGLFFIDSVTSPKTVGIRLAKELGMKSGRRNVFLDNEQDSSYILGQLNQAVHLAKKTGAAIAICHPHSVTIQTLEAALPGLEKQGVTLVPASRLVK
jgi:polysaccharide deacetylase 2 family uncharacterized protein YibQ